MSQLEKLAKLKDAGVLSEGEFGTAKQRVLGKPAGDTTVIRLPNTETSAGDNTPCVPPVGSQDVAIPVVGSQEPDDMRDSFINRSHCGTAQLFRKVGMVLRLRPSVSQPTGGRPIGATVGVQSTVHVEACAQSTGIEAADLWFVARLIGPTTLTEATVAPVVAASGRKTCGGAEDGVDGRCAWTVRFTPPEDGELTLEIRVQHYKPLAPQYGWDVTAGELLEGEPLQMQQYAGMQNTHCNVRCEEAEECVGWSSSDSTYGKDEKAASDSKAEWMTIGNPSCRLFSSITGSKQVYPLTVHLRTVLGQPFACCCLTHAPALLARPNTQGTQWHSARKGVAQLTNRSDWLGGSFMTDTAGHWNRCTAESHVPGGPFTVQAVPAAATHTPTVDRSALPPCTDGTATGTWVAATADAVESCNAMDKGDALNASTAQCAVLSAKLHFPGCCSWQGPEVPKHLEHFNPRAYTWQPHGCRIELFNSAMALQRLADNGIGLIDVCGDSTAHELLVSLWGLLANQPLGSLNRQGELPNLPVSLPVPGRPGQTVTIAECLSGLVDPFNTWLGAVKIDPASGRALTPALSGKAWTGEGDPGWIANSGFDYYKRAGGASVKKMQAALTGTNNRAVVIANFSPMFVMNH